MSFILVEAARDRAAVRRAVLGTLALAAGAGGLLIYEPQRPPVPSAAPPPAIATDHRLVIPGDAAGQCHVPARVNGTPFDSLLMDSGAFALTFGRNMATQLGIDPSTLSFSHSYTSANGVGRYASVRLREFRIDSFVMHDVPAVITDAAQSEPLLGIGILRRLNLQLKNGNCEVSWS